VGIWAKRVLFHVAGARVLGEPGGVGVELREKQLELLRLGLALRGVTLRGGAGRQSIWSSCLKVGEASTAPDALVLPRRNGRGWGDGRRRVRNGGLGAIRGSMPMRTTRFLDWRRLLLRGGNLRATVLPPLTSGPVLQECVAAFTRLHGLVAK
jgi:hypothetical protein